MTKQQYLNIIKLLSALESWGMGMKEMYPDYLADQLATSIDLLTAEVLK